jgi:hypothetical protein
MKRKTEPVSAVKVITGTTGPPSMLQNYSSLHQRYYNNMANNSTKPRRQLSCAIVIPQDFSKK